MSTRSYYYNKGKIVVIVRGDDYLYAIKNLYRDAYCKDNTRCNYCEDFSDAAILNHIGTSNAFKPSFVVDGKTVDFTNPDDPCFVHFKVIGFVGDTSRGKAICDVVIEFEDGDCNISSFKASADDNRENFLIFNQNGTTDGDNVPCIEIRTRKDGTYHLFAINDALLKRRIR